MGFGGLARGQRAAEPWLIKVGRFQDATGRARVFLCMKDTIRTFRVGHQHHFSPIEVFSGDILNFSISSKNEVNQCHLIELKALSDTIV